MSRVSDREIKINVLEVDSVKVGINESVTMKLNNHSECRTRRLWDNVLTLKVGRKIYAIDGDELRRAIGDLTGWTR